MRTAIAALALVSAVSAQLPFVTSSFNFSDSELVKDLSDFGYGFSMGFINVDIKNMQKCEFTYENATDRIHEIASKIALMKTLDAEDEQKEEALRDILHILEKLPEDTASCSDLTIILEKLSNRILTLFNIADLIGSATKNLALHSGQLVKDLSESSVALAFGNYYNAGYYLGRAIDLLLS